MLVQRIGPALVATAVMAAATAAPSPARPAHASALHRCSLSQRETETFGPTYVTSISVDHVSCRTAKRVVRAFHRCRKAHGGVRGRCPTTTSVLGYHCREKRGGIKTQFSGKVTCTAGVRRVVHTYTQFT
jgi:hypothetical protein